MKLYYACALFIIDGLGHTMWSSNSCCVCVPSVKLYCDAILLDHLSLCGFTTLSHTGYRDSLADGASENEMIIHFLTYRE